MKKLYQISLLFSRGKQIAICVCIVHLILLFILACHHLVTSRMRPTKSMVVKTIIPVEKKKTPTQNVLAQAPQQTTQPPAKKAVTAPSSTTKKVTSTPLMSSPKKPSQSISPASSNKTLLKEIAESFDAISKEPKKEHKSTLHIPSKVSPKSNYKELSVEEDPTYGEYLITFLQNMLDLPEYGEVKMEIEIDASGRLISSKILESKSKKNASFLKDELTHLSFPIPHLNPSEQSKIFSITFKNQ